MRNQEVDDMILSEFQMKYVGVDNKPPFITGVYMGHEHAVCVNEQTDPVTY
jgi:hypothetical protein